MNLPLRRRLLILGLALATALSLVAATSSEQSAIDAVRALEEGNRLARENRLDEAVDAYERGWDPGQPHPTLAYNLATTLHQLDRLPEAVLWYHRVGAREDAWRDENLFLARRSLGSQQIDNHSVWSWISTNGAWFQTLAVLAAWAALIVVLLGERWGTGRIVPLSLIALAVLAWGSVGVAGMLEPRAAVLLEDCRGDLGDLPAGTEAWVRPSGDDQFRVLATPVIVCSEDTIALVD
ncbi:MAG: hypothetical protein AAGD38_17865 [Acidobacteriota bacterium]